MDTSSLVLWAMGVVLIGNGLPVVYIARYFLAPEDQKARRARAVLGIGILWLIAGVGIYVKVLISRFT